MEAHAIQRLKLLEYTLTPIDWERPYIGASQRVGRPVPTQWEGHVLFSCQGDVDDEIDTLIELAEHHEDHYHAIRILRWHVERVNEKTVRLTPRDWEIRDFEKGD